MRTRHGRAAVATIAAAIAGAAAWLALATATLAQPKPIFPEPEVARAEVRAAIQQAGQSHKRVLLEFGGNWCGDCYVLDYYMHSPQLRPLLESNYVMVHVNVGHMDANTDLAARYQVPVTRGVPAMAVLDEHGRLLYSQRDKEGEMMSRTDPAALYAFLLRWKPTRPGCSAVMVAC